MANFNFTFQPGVAAVQILGFEMAGRIWSEYIQDDAVFNIHVAQTDELPSQVIGGAVPAYVTTDIEMVKMALGQDATSIDDAVAIANLNTTSASNGDTQYSALFNGTEYQSSDLTITNANAKALGLESLAPSNSVDGYVIFNGLDDSLYSWDYDFSRASTVANLELDFLGMALHEIGHIMGFVSGVDTIEAPAQPEPQPFSLFNIFGRFGGRNQVTEPVDLSQTSLLDLFRYSDRSADLNAQELTAGEAAYFSIDGGQTAIAALSSGQVEERGQDVGYQASHWGDGTTTSPEPALEFPSLLELITNPVGSSFKLVGGILSLPTNLLGGQYNTIASASSQSTNSLGIMDPSLVPGTRSNISALDLQALDVIGYDISDGTLSLDYASLLQEAQAIIAEAENGLTSFLDTEETFTFDDFDVIERRRRSVRTRRSVFFQEVDAPGNSEFRNSPSFPGNDTAKKTFNAAKDDALLGSVSTYGLVGNRDDDMPRQADEQSYISDGAQGSIRPPAKESDFTDTLSSSGSGLQVLFGISDSLVSGRNGTGSWLYGQSPDPITSYSNTAKTTPLSGGASFFRSWF